jgi:hypothetical protein
MRLDKAMDLLSSTTTRLRHCVVRLVVEEVQRMPAIKITWRISYRGMPTSKCFHHTRDNTCSSGYYW